jgi:hypothetical protein
MHIIYSSIVPRCCLVTADVLMPDSITAGEDEVLRGGREIDEQLSKRTVITGHVDCGD